LADDKPPLSPGKSAWNPKKGSYPPIFVGEQGTKGGKSFYRLETPH